MPMIDITASDGLFSPANEAVLLKRATDCLLQWEKVSGIPYAVANTGAFLSVLPRRRTTSGGKGAGVVRIQVLTPAKSLSQEQRSGIAAGLTDIVHELADDADIRERTWVLFHEAVDGGWGIAGKAFTNADLVDAVRASAIASRR
ncbi:4-oxalocrotonate tautomerase [Corallococcus exiguus]|uniref:tautomerase family protein n=1 Tax=Corallococcus TaxID=83461 RepID=UPI000EA37D3B|nr:MULTISPECIES: tautomerase family protein [Corallococcus]NNC16781.1 4-oxalocrotonate tautomerase [Corallococcus exiguus]RKH26285.1 4-oxalocrotonate tautomerase [Corallococcus sp. CA041A]RUO95178.1 4-oxalocrotonate tautomerase [Corallococcus sp. AB018]